MSAPNRGGYSYMEVLTKIWDFGPDFFKADFFEFFFWKIRILKKIVKLIFSKNFPSESEKSWFFENFKAGFFENLKADFLENFKADFFEKF